jgi:hypothetical protein
VGRLEDIYLSTWKKIIETQNVQITLQDYHYPELARWIASLYPEHFLKHLRKVPTIGHVVCEEYSPQLQVRLLGIEIHILKQPLLDIGCGKSARLVRHLRARHIEAYGIDRQIDRQETYLQQADWLNYDFQRESWGTITSNMAFANHLLYTYHHDTAQLGLYLRKFDEILVSLIVRGSFYYAPGLPFLEHALEADKYKVHCSHSTKGICTTKITKLEK